MVAIKLLQGLGDRLLIQSMAGRKSKPEAEVGGWLFERVCKVIIRSVYHVLLALFLLDIS